MMFLNTHNEWMKMQQMMHSSSADGGMMMMGHEGMMLHEGMMKYGYGGRNIQNMAVASENGRRSRKHSIPVLLHSLFLSFSLKKLISSESRIT